VITPTSTYRLQLTAEQDFDAAAALVPYLAGLGVDALYVSPVLTAAPGSTHGYDVADPTVVSAVLGGEEGRQRLLAALRTAGMGLVVDIVPNHLGVGVPHANPWWWDVLRLGEASAYARYFDIDWRTPGAAGRVLLPVLADSPAALDDLRVADGELRYFDKRYPLAPGTADLGDAKAVHEAQHYRLVPWRTSDQNYRRFFAVSDLAGIRVEDAAVFDATHAEIVRWAQAGELVGLRIDHPDGLADPAGYLTRLRAAVGPEVWLLVEKILEPGEALPDWPVAGTTGYDAMAEVDGVLVDPAGEAGFTVLDERLTGVPTVWHDLVHDCKLDVATGMLAAEVRRAARLAAEVPDAAPALAELAACFEVYRSYLPAGSEHLDPAMAAAAARRSDLAAALDALSPRLRDPADELASRFQQISGAVMAKGVEDTAYYRWTRFVAANEVGGDPARFGLAPADFGSALVKRARQHPAGMTSLSTHDTKRAADVRARLAVLAELPDEWAQVVDRWETLAPTPDPALGHLLWQTVAGSWPIERERLQAYLTKAIREARTRTSWNDPDAGFEAAMAAAADATYDNEALHADVSAFVDQITPYGWSNSLSATLLQLAMPGVPDTYQGTELWDKSLVDPDNRRPVDFAARSALLAAVDAGWPDRLPPVDATGAAKLLVVSRVLRLRRDRPGLFTDVLPLVAEGEAAEHAVAFGRGGGSDGVGEGRGGIVAVATRLPYGLRQAGSWRATTLSLPAAGRWTDAITGRSFTGAEPPLADLLDRYPVALLVTG
jgi:(1->4)-alpha-D-glucan 1-alpha-D-glucosylmutase